MHCFQLFYEVLLFRLHNLYNLYIIVTNIICIYTWLPENYAFLRRKCGAHQKSPIILSSSFIICIIFKYKSWGIADRWPAVLTGFWTRLYEAAAGMQYVQWVVQMIMKPNPTCHTWVPELPLVDRAKDVRIVKDTASFRKCGVWLLLSSPKYDGSSAGWR